MRLDCNRTREVIHARLAEPLGYSGEDGLLRVGAGILEMTSVIMAGAIKRVTLERGKDTREFALFAYGGGGPLHSAELARDLYIPLVVVPPEPGNFSATGMLLADARRGASRTVLLSVEDGSMPAVLSEFSGLDAQLSAELGAETGSAISIRRSVELRYRGQTHSVEVPFDGVGSGAELKARFLTGYKARYGHVDPTNAVELVGVRSTASAALMGPDVERLNPAAGASGTPRPAHRPVYFSDIGRAVETVVYRRATLPIGFVANGPALIEEYGSTTLVGPRDRFEVGRLGEIRIHISPKL